MSDHRWNAHESQGCTAAQEESKDPSKAMSGPQFRCPIGLPTCWGYFLYASRCNS